MNNLFDDIEFNIIDLLNSTIAILGFIFSLIALYLNRKDKKPKLNVENSFGFLTFSNQTVSDDTYIMVTISNSKEKSVKARSIELEISGKTERLMLLEVEGEVNLPKIFEVGDSHNFWKSEDEIRRVLSDKFKEQNRFKVKAVVNDGFGNKFKAKKYLQIDLNDI